MKRGFFFVGIVSLAVFIVSCGDGGTGPSGLPDASTNGGGVFGTAGQSSTLNAKRNFTAPLSGREEVPPVDTKGTGVAKFQLSKDGSELSFKLNVANIDNVTQSHIHLGPAGENGPVVLFLFGFVTGGVTVNGTLSEGTVTGADLVGPLSGESLAVLVDAMRAGNTYVNVHTVANPPGEIRGQIK